MKPNVTKIVFISTLLLLLFSIELLAQRKVKSTGLGLRVTYWNLTNNANQLKVVTSMDRSSVSAGNAGGWLFLTSRLNPGTLFEISLGAIGNVQEESYYYMQSDTDVFMVNALLFGIRMELVAPQSQGALKPYLSLGAGPYWFSTIQANQQLYEQQVKIDTAYQPGGYLGAGTNFLLADWLAINFDLKYHFIDFNVKHEYSGYEYGIGITFLFGKYKI